MWRLIQVGGVVAMLVGSYRCFAVRGEEAFGVTALLFVGGLALVFLSARALGKKGKDPGLWVKDFCPYCKKKIVAHALVCPFCQRDLKAATP